MTRDHGAAPASETGRQRAGRRAGGARSMAVSRSISGHRLCSSAPRTSSVAGSMYSWCAHRSTIMTLGRAGQPAWSAARKKGNRFPSGRATGNMR